MKTMSPKRQLAKIDLDEARKRAIAGLSMGPAWASGGCLRQNDAWKGTVVRLRTKHRGTTDKVFRHSQRRGSAGRGIGVQFALVFAVKRMRRTVRRTSTQTTHWKNNVRLTPEDA
jgi:hypothetical protein